MKISLGQILAAAGTVAVGIVAGPEAGAVVGGTLAAAKGAKVAGKAIERGTGKPVHKVAAPAVALAVPMICQALGVDLSGLCALIGQLCANPLTAAAGVGAGINYMHSLGVGARDAIKGRNPV